MFSSLTHCIISSPTQCNQASGSQYSRVLTLSSMFNDTSQFAGPPSCQVSGQLCNHFINSICNQSVVFSTKVAEPCSGTSQEICLLTNTLHSLLTNHAVFSLANSVISSPVLYVTNTLAHCVTSSLAQCVISSLDQSVSSSSTYFISIQPVNRPTCWLS